MAVQVYINGLDFKLKISTSSRGTRSAAETVRNLGIQLQPGFGGKHFEFESGPP